MVPWRFPAPACHLWEEVEAAYRCWEGHGRPQITQFGVTADEHGQRLWLDHP